MQSLLTSAIEFVFVSGVALYSYLFIAGLANRPARSTAPVRPLFTVEEEALIPQLTDLWIACDDDQPEAPATPASGNAIADTIVPFVRPQPKSPTVAEIDWSALDPFQLRKECAQRGIRWRNIYGKNKHLKKSEMLAALRDFEASIAS